MFDSNCIGRRGPSYDPSFQPGFHRSPSEAKLTQEEYRDLARENDLIFLPFDPDWYSLTASGTLLDCVRFGIPPLAVRNSVIDDLERRYGRFGFLVSSPSEGIDLLCRTDPATLFEDMEQFRGPLRAIAHDRTIEALSPGFRRIFSSPFQRG
ncbi:hypothetical protein [Sphingomonas sp. SRS2]|uniref:hypothetical protein n=1 Tax=Sphingomonas sp. SRS2 TaxID=133190 RepID=UPI00128CF57A|nr:hypothetical protein [Sphingomonas sp. SRS2]